MNHKQIIILTLIIVFSVIIIVAASVLIAAAVYGKKLNVHTSKELDGVDPEMCTILYYASIVGNSHNTQLWKLNIHLESNNKKGKIEICYDERRVLSVVDPTKRESYISLGLYIESLMMLLQTYGYDANLTYPASIINNVKNDQISSPVSIIYYAKNKQTKTSQQKIDEIISLIEKRHTDKGSFKKNKLTSEHVNLLKQKFTNDLSIYLNGEENFNYIKDKTIDSIKTQSNDQAYRDELAEWLRFSNKESNQKLDGINADMMGFSGLKKGFYYMTIHRKTAKGNKFAKQGISTAKNQVKNCGSFILVLGDTSSIASHIEIGRTVHRIWLECTKNGISLHPMSSILEIDPYKSNIKNDLKLNKNVQMVFRAGYSKKYGSNIKLRRNLKDYITVLK